MGVQHFYLYNNSSTDSYQEILNPYIKSGEVELIGWSYEWFKGYQELIYENATNKKSQYSPLYQSKTKIFSEILTRHAQLNAYNDAVKKAVGVTKWLAFLDIDEFLFPVHNDNLIDFLKDFEAYAGVCVNWQFYGTSFVDRIPNDKLLIETLIYKAPYDTPSNAHVKSIVRPDYVLRWPNPHACIYKPGYYQVNTNKVSFAGAVSPEILIDKARINHYWPRDEHYFTHSKIPRLERIKGWSKEKIGWIIETNKKVFNQVKDTTIFKVVPHLKKVMGL